MPKKINSRFSFSLIASVVLHVGFIAVIGYSAIQYVIPDSGDIKGDSIDAIMVDSSIMTEQYQRQLQHKLSTEKAKQQQQQQIEKQAKELQEQQLAEQQRLKELAKESLLAQENQQKEQEALLKAKQEAEKVKLELEEQQKQALLAKQKAELEAKLLAQKQLEEKQRIEAEQKKAELEKQEAIKQAEKAKQEKLKAEQAAKQKAIDDKRQLDDILDGFASTVPSSQRGVSTDELNQFKSQVYNAISSKFINPNNLYSGQTCVLKIQIAADGLLLSVAAEQGDSVLCREAISATRLAKFPKPKSAELYNQVKNLTIDFKPK